MATPAAGHTPSQEVERTPEALNKHRRDSRNWIAGTAYTGPVIGQVFYRLEAYIARDRHVMTHATAAGCALAGVTPGRMNA